MAHVVLRSSLQIRPMVALDLLAQLAAITQLQTVHLPLVAWSSTHATVLNSAVDTMANRGGKLTVDLLLDPDALEPADCPSLDALDVEAPGEAAAAVKSVYVDSTDDVGMVVSYMTAATKLELWPPACITDSPGHGQVFCSHMLSRLTQLRELHACLAGDTDTGGETGGMV
eukprot:jgi/Ulvmu1/10750/UM068_0040.1